MTMEVVVDIECEKSKIIELTILAKWNSCT